ncbi:MAG: hypothetical protein H6825_05035 [Planctomycetes bacterium]|nr:hypothetical protein [Planctomycetota bacterium]
MDDRPAGSNDLATLDRRLAFARADLDEHTRLTARLESSRRRLAALRARLARLRERVEREKRDVDALDGASLAAFAVRLLGDFETRHAKENAEWVAARLRLEDAEAELSAAAEDVRRDEQHLASLADPLPAYHALLAEKRRWLESHDAGAHEQILHLAEQEGALRDLLRELDEAVWAGQVARGALVGMLHALSRAQSLGKLDMIGISPTWVKFEHIDDAHRHASAANRALSRFQLELSDVAVRHEAHIAMEVGSLATFADYIFDDLVSDWVVQCRIDKSHRSAAVARTRVNRTLRLLEERRMSVRAELAALESRRRALGGGS